MAAVHIKEHLLQLIWEKQYLRQDELFTSDRRRVHVLTPGRVSLNPGPDIRQARLMLDGRATAGDIEIHRTAEEWLSHGHDTNPAYNSVILHVLLYDPPPAFVTRTQQGREIPMLSLEHVLIDDLNSLRVDAMFDEYDLRSGRIRCSGQNDHVPGTLLGSFLDRLAVERMEIKLRRIQERLHELARAGSQSVREHERTWLSKTEDPDAIPPPFEEITHMDISRRDIWEQVLYEGCLEALGYRRNRRPFIRLGQILALESVRMLRPDPIQTEALLFGVSGLLPSVEDGQDVEGREYIHVLRNEWHRLRSRLRGEVLSGHEWVRTAGRPANSLHVRIVAARALIGKLTAEDLFPRLLQALKHPSKNPRGDLHVLFSVDPGPFWERRTGFSRIARGRVQPIGSARKDDIIINTVVPLFMLYARIFRDPSVREGVLNMLLTYPALQSNSITRRIERHILRPKMRLTSAVRHQGAMQLFNYYCREERCRECDIGRLVWG